MWLFHPLFRLCPRASAAQSRQSSFCSHHHHHRHLFSIIHHPSWLGALGLDLKRGRGNLRCFRSDSHIQSQPLQSSSNDTTRKIEVLLNYDISILESKRAKEQRKRKRGKEGKKKKRKRGKKEKKKGKKGKKKEKNIPYKPSATLPLQLWVQLSDRPTCDSWVEISHQSRQRLLDDSFSNCRFVSEREWSRDLYR